MKKIFFILVLIVLNLQSANNAILGNVIDSTTEIPLLPFIPASPTAVLYSSYYSSNINSGSLIDKIGGKKFSQLNICYTPYSTCTYNANFAVLQNTNMLGHLLMNVNGGTTGFNGIVVQLPLILPTTNIPTIYYQIYVLNPDATANTLNISGTIINGASTVYADYAVSLFNAINVPATDGLLVKLKVTASVSAGNVMIEDSTATVVY